MRAIQITRLDGPGAAELVEIDEPTDTDAVIIDVYAAGVAFPDALQTRGLYQHRPELPYVPGAELAGVVRSAPAGAHVVAGDRVAALTMLNGAMAEVVAVPADRVFKLPDVVSFEAGAGILFNDLTVHCTLRTRGKLVPGETVLVHGAAGGIGTSTLRLATAFGASRAIAVVSTEDKADVARAAGATDVVLADGFKDRVKELTGGRGVSVVTGSPIRCARWPLVAGCWWSASPAATFPPSRSTGYCSTTSMRSASAGVLGPQRIPGI